MIATSPSFLLSIIYSFYIKSTFKFDFFSFQCILYRFYYYNGIKHPVNHYYQPYKKPYKKQMLNWNPRFQFAKVNLFSEYFLQE